MGFAAYTHHAWEDYWITFRSSRNLAEGNGLVFQPGERLHTFTSPLGVLLPAAAYLLTFNSSDYAALWIFRGFSSLALGGAALMLYAMARRLRLGGPATVALLALVATDAKILDFTINGMETGVLLLFLAWTVFSLFAPVERRWLHLGLAWAGLMWTRPDSFIYIGILAAGAWIFNRSEESGLSRSQWIKVFFQSGLVTTAVYLPWLVIAQIYYGSPIPHTITAKGLSNPAPTLTRAIEFLQQLPAATYTGTNSFAATFLPSYFIGGGWPLVSVAIGRFTAIGVALAWLVPGAGRLTRTCSLTFLAGHLYLSFFPYFPFPWYLPTTAMLAFITLAGLIHDFSRSPRLHAARLTVAAAVVVIVINAVGLTVGSARQLATAQQLIEDGVRKEIGLHLKAAAKPGDSVFLEPLGYIGYFSQLKMHDFPGLSSLEMTNARRRLGSDWSYLINDLDPDWLVLRDHEIQQLEQKDPAIFAYLYQVDQVFDNRAKVEAADIPGKAYLIFDSRFTVYRRARESSAMTSYGTAYGAFLPPAEKPIHDQLMMMVHAPGELVVPVPASAREMTVRYAVDPAAYESVPPSDATDGAMFMILWRDSTGFRPFWSRYLDPLNEPADRGVMTISFPLPPTSGEATVILRSLSGPSLRRDWTAWSKVDFR